MSLSKTQILGWVAIFLGVLTELGIDVPAGVVENAVSGIFDNSTTGVLAIYGAITIWLRTLTDSPVVKGIKGVLFKKTTEEKVI